MTTIEKILEINELSHSTVVFINIRTLIENIENKTEKTNVEIEFLNCINVMYKLYLWAKDA